MMFGQCCHCGSPLSPCTAIGGWESYDVKENAPHPIYPSLSAQWKTVNSLNEYNEGVRLLAVGACPGDDDLGTWNLPSVSEANEYLDEIRTLLLVLSPDFTSEKAAVNSFLTAIGSTIQWDDSYGSYDGMATAEGFLPALDDIHVVNPETLTGGLPLYSIGSDVVAAQQKVGLGRIVVVGCTQAVLQDPDSPSPDPANNSRFIDRTFTWATCVCTFARFPDSFLVDFPDTFSRSLGNDTTWEPSYTYNRTLPLGTTDTNTFVYNIRRRFADAGLLNNTLTANIRNPLSNALNEWAGSAGTKYQYLEHTGNRGNLNTDADDCYPIVTEYADTDYAVDFGQDLRSIPNPVADHFLCGQARSNCNAAAGGQTWQCALGDAAWFWRIRLVDPGSSSPNYWEFQLTEIPVYENIQYMTSTAFGGGLVALKNYGATQSQVTTRLHPPWINGNTQNEIYDAIKDDITSEYAALVEYSDLFAGAVTLGLYRKTIDCETDLVGGSPLILPLVATQHVSGGAQFSEVHGLGKMPLTVSLTPDYI